MDIGWIRSQTDDVVALRPTSDTLTLLGLEDVRFIVTCSSNDDLATYCFQGQFDLGMGPRSYNLMIVHTTGGINGSVLHIDHGIPQQLTAGEHRAGIMLARRLVATLQPTAFDGIEEGDKGQEKPWPGSSQTLKDYWSQIAQQVGLPQLGQVLPLEYEALIAAFSQEDVARETRYLLWQAEQLGLQPEYRARFEDRLEIFFKHLNRYARVPSINDIGHDSDPLPYEG